MNSEDNVGDWDEQSLANLSSARGFGGYVRDWEQRYALSTGLTIPVNILTLTGVPYDLHGSECQTTNTDSVRSASTHRSNDPRTGRRIGLQ